VTVAEGAAPVISVEDDGLGVPPGVRYALERPPAGPAGLGLRFCRAAIEAHGGRLWIDDLDPRGTAVRFTVG
jgi:signal transduction histidine kinase